MPRLEADFSQISSSFENLPEGDYRVVIEDIEESTTKENNLPALMFKLKVTEGPQEGKYAFDHVTLKKRDGKRNDIGYGRVKAYAEATMGKEYANSGAIDTDELKGNVCIIIVKHESFAKKNPDGTSGEQETRAKIAKVLAA